MRRALYNLQIMTDNNYDPPEPSAGDAAHTLSRAGLSAIPGAGGPLAELMNFLWTAPIEKKRQNWRFEVAAAIRRLEEKVGLSPGVLAENGDFVETVAAVTIIDVQNVPKVKIDALRAAVENAPRDDSPDIAIQQSYLKLVEELSEWHLRILTLFQDPRGWFRNVGQEMRTRLASSTLESVLTDAFPELRGKRSFYDQVWRDLRARGLVTTDSLQGTMSVEGALSGRTTEMGHDFLAFITSRES
jgi:hypothetical protein